jgi:HK97 family phage prohead protease
MIIRSKSGDYSVRSRIALLDYLHGVTTDGGKVKEDVALFVPITLKEKSEQGTVSSEQENIVSWTFSTFDLDRYDERVDPQGWELGQYKRNPVVQWAHRYDIPAIGVSSSINTDEKGLHGHIIFNKKEFDPFGWSIGERVKAGVLRAGSVGFRVLEIELPEREAQADGTSLIFRKQELLEFSICNVPANPFALSRSDKGEVTSDKLHSVKVSDFFGGFFNNAIH